LAADNREPRPFHPSASSTPTVTTRVDAGVRSKTTSESVNTSQRSIADWKGRRRTVDPLVLTPRDSA